jgi:hypothetical protein
MGLDRPAWSRDHGTAYRLRRPDLHMDTIATAFAQACKRGELRSMQGLKHAGAQAKLSAGGDIE